MAPPFQHPLAFEEKVSLDELQRLISCPEDTPVTLWSMQQPGAIECLKTDGRLTGNPDFAFAPDKTGRTPAGKKGAYTWMQEQMAKRLPSYNQELPIWALLSRPNDTTRPNDQLLRIELPKTRMLVSFYQPWPKLLSVMDCLERHNWLWPDHWSVSACCPYFSADAEDQKEEFVDTETRQRRDQWDEQLCRASWERMFDLKLARFEGFLWTPICLQAMLPTIFHSDVREVLPLHVRHQ